jgi:hypothetical protein
MFSNRAIRLPPDSPTDKIMLSLTTFSDAHRLRGAVASRPRPPRRHASTAREGLRRAHHKRGTSVCGNGLAMRIERIDDAVLGTLGGDVLRPEVVMAILDGVVDAMSPTTCAR